MFKATSGVAGTFEISDVPVSLVFEPEDVGASYHNQGGCTVYLHYASSNCLTSGYPVSPGAFIDRSWTGRIVISSPDGAVAFFPGPFPATMHAVCGKGLKTSLTYIKMSRKSS